MTLRDLRIKRGEKETRTGDNVQIRKRGKLHAGRVEPVVGRRVEESVRGTKKARAKMRQTTAGFQQKSRARARPLLINHNLLILSSGL